jgi:WD40 repeat protein
MGAGMIYLEGRKQDVNALAFSPNGKLLAVAGTASNVQLWDLESGTVRKVLGPSGPHVAFAFLPGGRIMTATGNSALRIESLDGTGPRQVYTGDGTRAEGYTFIRAAPTAPVDAVVLCGCHRYAPLLECVNLPDLKLRWRKTGREVGEQPFRLAPCPDGRMAVATDHRTYLIDPTTSERTQEVGWHLNFVPALAVSPDGSLLAVAAGLDLQLYLPATAQRLESARGEGRKHFTDVAFHPSGRWLLVSSKTRRCGSSTRR